MNFFTSFRHCLSNKTLSILSKISYLSIIAFLVLPCPFLAFAAHPLVTDDAGTQGMGKYQLELNGQYGHDKDNGVTQNTTQIASTLTYGILDNVDVAVGIPYLLTLTRTESAGDGPMLEGPSDASIAVKWKFLDIEKDKLNFALKPGITLPTGNKGKLLGTGRVTYSLFFIATKDLEPLVLHVNLGYIRNENKLDQRTNLWHGSLASEVKIFEELKFVTNIGGQRDFNKFSSTYPMFILGGFIYSISENLDVDVGYKHALNNSEADHTVLAGLTFKF